MVLREQALEQHAADQLRAAGFPFVQLQPKLRALVGDRVLRADLIAWDANEAGELEPRVLVDAKLGFGRLLEAKPADALGVFRQLSAYANAFGTTEAFVVDENGWYRVAETFDAAEFSEVPRPFGPEATGAVPDGLVTQLVSDAAWQLANRARDEGRMVDLGTVLEPFLEQLEPAAAEGDLPQPLRHPSNGRSVLRALLRDVMPRLQGRGSYLTPWNIAEVMARLADPQPRALVRDPFAGLGTCLWATAQCESSVELRASELNASLAGYASRLGALAAYRVDVQKEDALEAGDDFESDVVVSNPPMGRKLAKPTALASGGQTTDGDVAVLDRVHRWLRPGGRAVLLMAAGVLFRGGVAERVRAFLQSKTRVSAVISLPTGVLKPYTMIAPVILVLDRTDPGETLVARLGDDWQEQLSPTGEFLKTFLQHTEAAG